VQTYEWCKNLRNFKGVIRPPGFRGLLERSGDPGNRDDNFCGIIFTKLERDGKKGGNIGSGRIPRFRVSIFRDLRFDPNENLEGAKIMKTDTVSKDYRFEGSPASSPHSGMKSCGLSTLPPGLSKSKNRQARFDSMNDLRKFLKNFCCVPGNDQLGGPLGVRPGV
jgi:hypothetical protein